MNLPERAFFNGARRRAQLLEKGDIMFMGRLADTAPTSFSDDLLSIVKNVLPIVQQQQIFNRQLSSGQAPVTYGGTPAPVATNYGRIAILAGGGVVAFLLLSKLFRK